MKVNNINKTSFGNLTKTRELMETVLQKNFQSEGIDSVVNVVKSVYPNQKPIGRYRGYKYYGGLIKELVNSQYPQLSKDISTISEHIKENPKISKKELSDFVEPYIQKYGETIDIKA